MKNVTTLNDQIIKSVEELDEERVIKLANKALKSGMDPLFLLNLINEGVKRVGKLYEERKYFIADLIMAGLIFKEVLELEEIKAQFQRKDGEIKGKVVVGTVKGDLHDIGKEIFKGLMEVNGFEVIDLGVDVPEDAFVKSVIKHKPDIVGLSGVLTTAVESMKDVVEALKRARLRDSVKIIVGGSYITEELCEYIGADSFANDASEGVKICSEFIKSECGG